MLLREVLTSTQERKEKYSTLNEALLINALRKMVEAEGDISIYEPIEVKAKNTWLSLQGRISSAREKGLISLAEEAELQSLASIIRQPD